MDMASMIGMPKPSPRVGSTKASTAAYRRGMSCSGTSCTTGHHRPRYELTTHYDRTPQPLKRPLPNGGQLRTVHRISTRGREDAPGLAKLCVAGVALLLASAVARSITFHSKLLLSLPILPGR
jgi:hypothetical protein